MGIDLERFVSTIDEELKCAICCLVLENAVQLAPCEHTFCADCINEWMQRHPSCPIDRRELKLEDIIPASRLLNSFLSRLNVKCDFADLGCNTVVTIESLASHLSQCNHNPEKAFACEKGCGVMLTNKQKADHNCVLEDILLTLEGQNEKIAGLEKLIETNNCTVMRTLKALEDKCRAVEELESKYLTLESKYTKLLITSNFEFIDSDSSSEHANNEINGRRVSSGGNNVHHRSLRDSNPKVLDVSRIFKTVNVEVDHKLKTLQISANIYEPIGNLKQKISKLENISTHSQCLFYDDQLLSDDLCISDYTITSPQFVLVKRPIKIDILIFSESISLLVEPNEIIANIKEKLRRLRGLSVTLGYFGQILDDNRTLYSYKIRDRAKLKVTAINCNKERGKSLPKINI